MQRRHVLLLAGSGAAVDVLVEVLQSFELDVVRLADLIRGESLTTAVLDAARDAALAIVIWDSARLPRAVMFEAGLAVGSGTPVVVLDARTGKDSKSTDVVQDALLQVPRMHARLQDRQALTQELTALLPSLNSRTAVIPPRRRKMQWPIEGVAVSGDEAVRRAAQALGLGGAEVLAMSGRLRVPDLLAQVPDLGSAFNPVLVEVAGRRAPLERKREQLLEALEERRALLGLLVCLDPVSPTTRISRRGKALVEIALEDLELEPSLGVSTLLRARNDLIHGRG